MRKILTMIISIFMLIMNTSDGMAQNKNDTTITLQIDNTVMRVNEVETEIDSNQNTAPVIINERAFVPIRTIIEGFGGSVRWEQSTYTATLNYKDNEIKLIVDSKIAYLNNEPQELDTAPTIINERIMLPIRFIADSFGFNTEWEESNQIITINNLETQEENNMLYIKVNSRVLTATLVENTSTKALIDLLKTKDITIEMSDYANFEKVGNLKTNLPRNDEQITTQAGDLILYQGNQFVIYYDTNSWNFTRLGKINNITNNELKSVLGKSNVTVTLSLNNN